jgi:hypothetical protein
MAKGDRWSDNQDVEVREMRSAETVLGVIRERGRRWSFANPATRPFIANGRAGIRSEQKPLESRGEIERLKPGSEGDGWKRAAKAAPRWPPTLPPAGFDERGVETGHGKAREAPAHERAGNR